MNVDPVPCMLTHSMQPPSAETIACAIASPSPPLCVSHTPRRVTAEKSIEDKRQMLGQDSDALIRKAHANLTVQVLQRDEDSRVTWGVFDCIV